MGPYGQHFTLVFLVVTCLAGGGIAFASGRAIARAWRPYWRVLILALALGLVLRVAYWGFYQDALHAPRFFIADLLVLLVAASAGWRLMRTKQMVARYRWLYRQTSPFMWTNRR